MSRYLLVLWYEWWARIYKFSYNTGSLIGTCQWILWISCQQHHHGEIRIRNKNRLFFLYATTNQKEKINFSYIFILNERRERYPMRLKFHVGWVAVELFVELNICICCLDKARYYLLCTRKQWDLCCYSSKILVL